MFISIQSFVALLAAIYLTPLTTDGLLASNTKLLREDKTTYAENLKLAYELTDYRYEAILHTIISWSHSGYRNSRLNTIMFEICDDNPELSIYHRFT